MDLPILFDPIWNSLALVLKSLEALSPKLLPDAYRLLSLMASISISLLAIKSLLGGQGVQSFMAQLIWSFIWIGLCYALLARYLEWFGPQGALIESFKMLALNFDPEGVAQQTQKVMSLYLFLALKVLQATPVTSERLIGADELISSDSLESVWMMGSAEFWQNLLDEGMAYLIRLLSALIICIAGALFSAQMLLAQMAYSIGVIVGPIMIPCLLWEVTRFVFAGFLRFMLQAGFWKLVSALVLGLSQQSLSVLATHLESVQAQGENQTGLALSVLILVLILSYLMSQVPSLVGMLLNGSAFSLYAKPMMQTGLSSIARLRMPIPRMNTNTSGGAKS